MRTSVIFLIALFAVSAFASNGKLSINNRIQNLKKTSWGKVAAQMIELQLTLGGAVDELIGAFYQLSQDLNFQVETEAYQWTLKTADHNAIDQAINDRINTAETNIHAATHEIENVLQPLQESLEGQIAYDENLVSQTNTAMDTATTQRGTENTAYNEKVQEHTNAIAAVQECMQLLNELDNNPTLIQMTKAKNHIKKLEHHLNQKFEYGEMIKVMIDLAQNFADQKAVKRVQAMLANVLGDLQTSLSNAHDDEAGSVIAYDNFMTDSQNTLDQAHTRLTENRAALEAAQNEEANQVAFRETNQANLDTANDDLDAETSRWDSETTMHNTLMGELQDELDAIDDILELCSSVDLSDDLNASLNSI